MKKLIFIILVLSFSSVCRASTLSTAATSLSPGQFTTVIPSNTTGYSDDYFLVYAQKAVYDPVNKKILFYGAGNHGSAPKFMIYDEATNTLSNGPSIPAPATGTGNLPVAHGNAENTVDDFGNLYWHIDSALLCGGGFPLYSCSQPSNLPVTSNYPDSWKYNIATNTWTPLAVNPARATGIYDQGCCEGWAFFPEIHKLVLPDPYGRIWGYDVTNDTWSQLTTYSPTAVDSGSGTYTWVIYNPVTTRIVFGNNVGMFSMSASLVVTQLTNVNSNGLVLYNGSGYAGGVVPDVTTGNLIAWSSAAQTGPWTPTVWKYDPNNNAAGFVNLNVSIPAINPPINSGNLNDYEAATPIDRMPYGVNGYLYCGPSSSLCATQILLYKNAPMPTADQDFTRRCAASGVVKCWGMDNTTTDIVQDVTTHPSGLGVYPQLDTTVKASGAGSLKFTLPPPPNGGANIAGKFAPYPSSTGGVGTFNSHTFKEGDTFYQEFRLRVSPDMLTNTWSSYWKFFETDHNADTCGELAVVGINKDLAGRPFFYTACGGRFIVTTDNYNAAAASNPTPVPREDQSGDYRCVYGTWAAGTCYTFSANQWATFQFKIRIGTWGTASSDVEAWVADEGASQWKQILNVHNYTFDCPNNCTTDRANGLGFNVGLFLPYMTSLDPNSGTPGVTSYMWVDEYIISTQPIALPIGPIDSIPPTVVITSPTNNYTTASNTVNMAGTCTDNVACTQVTWSNDRGGSGNAVLASGWTANGIPLQTGLNNITITGKDAALNAGTATLAVTYNPSASQASIKINSGGGNGIKLNSGGGNGVRIGH